MQPVVDEPRRGFGQLPGGGTNSEPHADAEFHADAYSSRPADRHADAKFHADAYSGYPTDRHAEFHADDTADEYAYARSCEAHGNDTADEYAHARSCEAHADSRIVVAPLLAPLDPSRTHKPLSAPTGRNPPAL